MKQLKDQRGQGLVEYMILLALVVLVCVGSTKALGTKINSRFKDMRNTIDNSIKVKIKP